MQPFYEEIDHPCTSAMQLFNEEIGFWDSADASLMMLCSIGSQIYCSVDKMLMCWLLTSSVFFFDFLQLIISSLHLQEDESVMDNWHPEDKAMFPDYFANREKWYKIRRKTWGDEMKCLQDWDKQNREAVSFFYFYLKISALTNI